MPQKFNRAAFSNALSKINLRTNFFFSILIFSGKISSTIPIIFFCSGDVRGVKR